MTHLTQICHVAECDLGMDRGTSGGAPPASPLPSGVNLGVKCDKATSQGVKHPGVVLGVNHSMEKTDTSETRIGHVTSIWLG